MNNPLVSIAVLNWNGENHIHRCLQHVAAQTYKPIQVIVVDNGSTDGSLDKILSKYPGTSFIKNKTNLGYSVGMTQAIAAAKGEFVLLLNQDAALDKDFVKECVPVIAGDDSIGVIGGRVFSWLGDTLSSELRQNEGERFFFRKRFQGLCGDKAEGEMWVFAPSGSFPFFRKSMLEDLKKTSGYYYDESFVTGWEDVDLAFRMHLRGWKCLFYPKAFGWHVGSGSVGGKSTLLAKDIDYQTRIIRNRYFTIIKDLPADTLLWLLPYILMAEIAVLPYLIIKSPRSLAALFSAWLQVYRAFPDLLAKRRKIQNNVLVEKGFLKQYFKAI